VAGCHFYLATRFPARTCLTKKDPGPSTATPVDSIQHILDAMGIPLKATPTSGKRGDDWALDVTKAEGVSTGEVVGTVLDAVLELWEELPPEERRRRLGLIEDD